MILNSSPTQDRTSHPRKYNRGVSLIDVLVGTAIMILLFMGIFGLFRAAIGVTVDSRARAGATALVQERMEYVRSLPYDQVGTVGGSPSGIVPEEEDVSLNNVDYHRRTVITYYDSPADGTGANDENGVTLDYKQVKVEVEWQTKNKDHHMQVVTKVVPDGVETGDDIEGGALRFHVFDAEAEPINDARVAVVNASTGIDFVAETNASGTATRLGIPAGSGYEITVTKTGYSTSQTYDVTGTNVHPSPGHLYVIKDEMTSASFQIDLLSSLTVHTQSPPEEVIFSDLFVDATQLSSTTDTAVSGDVLHVASSATSGRAYSVDIGGGPIESWGEFDATATIPTGATVEYQFYNNGNGNRTLIPEMDLPGNTEGFTSVPIDLSDLSTSTYETIQIGVYLASGSGGGLPPKIKEWQLDYLAGSTPISDVPFTIRGEKTIGENASEESIYKTTLESSTDTNGSTTIEPLEWDTYLTTINATSTGYMIAESCLPQPLSVLPDTDSTLTLTLAPSSPDALLVSVYDNLGNLVSGASTNLTGEGVDLTQVTSDCGQAYFGEALGGVGDYVLEVTVPGYDTTTTTVTVDEYTTERVDLVPSI